MAENLGLLSKFVSSADLKRLRAAGYEVVYTGNKQGNIGSTEGTGIKGERQLLEDAKQRAGDQPQQPAQSMALTDPWPAGPTVGLAQVSTEPTEEEIADAIKAARAVTNKFGKLKNDEEREIVLAVHRSFVGSRAPKLGPVLSEGSWPTAESTTAFGQEPQAQPRDPEKQ